MTTLEKLTMAIETYKTFPTAENKKYIVKMANQLEIKS